MERYVLPDRIYIDFNVSPDSLAIGASDIAALQSPDALFALFEADGGTDDTVGETDDDDWDTDCGDDDDDDSDLDPDE